MFLWRGGCFYSIILLSIVVNYKYFLVLNLPNREFCVNLHDYSIYMKLRLLFALVAAAAMMTVVGCNDDDKNVESARTTIERYLTSSHSPRLIPESEVANSIVYNPPFYEKLNQDLYRYIATYYDQGRQQRDQVEWGDQVELRVTAYVFTGSTPNISAVYYTNEQSVIESLAKGGLDTQYWTTEPMVVKLGETNIIKGVEESLLGCREGDRVEAYMTSKLAYDDKAIGIVKKEASVLWVYTIEKLTR